jgi:hypothetical protein
MEVCTCFFVVLDPATRHTCYDCVPLLTMTILVESASFNVNHNVFDKRSARGRARCEVEAMVSPPGIGASAQFGPT